MIGKNASVFVGKGGSSWWLPCAVLSIAGCFATGCGGSGIGMPSGEKIDASTLMTEMSETTDSTASEEGDGSVKEFIEFAQPGLTASSALGPILTGRTISADRGYRVGDWLTPTNKRDLKSVSVVDDPDHAFACQLISGGGVGDYNTVVKVRLKYSPTARGHHRAKLKFVWRTVPNSGTGSERSGTTGIEGYAAKLQIESVSSGNRASLVRGGLQASFLPTDTLKFTMSAFPAGQVTNFPANALMVEWRYQDEGGERTLTKAFSDRATDSKLITLAGGVAKYDAGFAARRGRDYTKGSTLANGAIGVRVIAKLTLDGASETVEISGSDTASGYAFAQDGIDRLRQEYWDFNQNPQRRAANYDAVIAGGTVKSWSYRGDRVRYAVPDRSDIGPAIAEFGSSPYGVVVNEHQNRFVSSIRDLRSQVAGTTVVAGFRSPRKDVDATDRSDSNAQMHPKGTLVYGPHIYGNAYDVAATDSVRQACKNLRWANIWATRAGGRATYIEEPGSLIHIGY